MEKIYYKTSLRQVFLFLFTLCLCILVFATNNIIVLAILCLAVINTCMLHFSFFIDTRNQNVLNKLDFVLQIGTLVFVLLKFFLLTTH